MMFALLALLSACNTPEKKQSSETTQECRQKEREAENQKIELQIQNDLKILKQMGVLVEIVPTTNPLGATVRTVMDRRSPQADFPRPTVDILGQLGVILENEFNGEFGVTDDVIRGLADRSYGKLGIADPSMRGWTLSFRLGEADPLMSMDLKQKKVYIAMGIKEVLSIGPAEHELTHFLTGDVAAGNNAVARLAREYIAIAGESRDPAGLRAKYDFERMNLAILGVSGSMSSPSNFIHAYGTPLDDWRYDLMRLTDEVIGEDGQVKLARQLYEQTKSNNGLTLIDMQNMFMEAGIKDLALFNKNVEAGLYLDLTFQKDGAAVILAKTIDSNGNEGITPAPMQPVWRNNDGLIIGAGSPRPLQSSLTILDGATVAPYASSLEVVVSGETYTFIFENH
jgi:hypothetical protein